MAVIYNCIYCGKAIESDMIYEGNFSELEKWINNKSKELSDKCECKI